MKSKTKVLLIRGLYPDQKKILESEVKDFDIEKMTRVFGKLVSPGEKYFLLLQKYFDFIQIITNSEYHQKLWEENYFKDTPVFVQKLVDETKPISKIDFYASKDFYRILAKQIMFFRPDILINIAVGYINPYFLKKLKEEFKFKLVGYFGATLVPVDMSVYDFFFSPFMPAIIRAKKYGVKAKLIPFGIDKNEIEEILKEVPESEKGKYDIVFSGSLHFVHKSRKILLEKIAEHFGERFYLFTQSEYALTPALKKVYRGKVFGKENIKTLAMSKIVINHHGDILPWAHNIRIYEATAVGSLLITDNLPGLKDLFAIGKEVIVYDDFDECIKLIERYLENEEERKNIAESGRRRTLKDHINEKRAKELAEIINSL